jgi:hypothetical protein
MIFQTLVKTLLLSMLTSGASTSTPTQYFDGITPELWSYQIVGYQVLAKWLKDHKGRFLTAADTQHYSRIVMALSRTVVVQSEIGVHIASVLT